MMPKMNETQRQWLRIIQDTTETPRDYAYAAGYYWMAGDYSGSKPWIILDQAKKEQTVDALIQGVIDACGDLGLDIPEWCVILTP